MAKKYNKKELIVFGQDISNKIKPKIKSSFSQRPPLPGYGKLNDIYYEYDVKLTFSLSKILKAKELDELLNIEIELTEMFVNEIQHSLIYHMYNYINACDVTFNVDNLEKILNFAKYNKKSYLIISKKWIEYFETHQSFTSELNNFLVGYDEIYKLGNIDSINIYVNPLESNENIFILLNENFIEYGIEDNAVDPLFVIDGKDVKMICSFYNIIYSVNSNQNYQRFFLE